MLKVVDIIEKRIVNFVYHRIDVARHSDIDEEHRVVLSPVNDLFCQRLSDDEVWRPCRADHDIGTVHVVGEVFKRDRSALEYLRQFDGALERTIRNQHGRNARPLQVLRRKLAHFAGADDHDALSGKIAENLSGQLDGGVADGNCRLRNSRFATIFLCHGKRAIHERAQVHANGPGIGCDPVSIFNLAENLWLANHHRIQTCSNAKNVADHFRVPKAIEMF